MRISTIIDICIHQIDTYTVSIFNISVLSASWIRFTICGALTIVFPTLAFSLSPILGVQRAGPQDGKTGHRTSDSSDSADLRGTYWNNGMHQKKNSQISASCHFRY